MSRPEDPFAHARQPAAPLRPVADPACWSAAEMNADRAWLYEFEDSEIAELEAAVSPHDRDGVDLLTLGRGDFPLPGLAQSLAEIRQELLYGRGFVLFRGLPTDRFGARGSAIAFWAIGSHLGDDFLSQNKHGDCLGHVMDLGQSRSNPSQRGPYSREEIPFHVDCCDIVGLLCMEVSESGGESSIASSVAVHNAILERRPDLLEVLTHPYYRDRRDEIPPGMKPWYAIPVFNYRDGYFSGNVEPTYIGSAHRFDEVPEMTPLQREALSCLQDVAAELRFDQGFQQGDMQFLNNHVIFHTRRAFTDYPDRKRHLLRLWLKARDGRPLPDAFYERHGAVGDVDRPGGIVGPDTVRHAPIFPD